MSVTLTGELQLSRALIFEVVGNPNDTPRYVVSGTVGSVSGGGSATMGKQDQVTLDGSFRQYGNGNTRLILGSSTTRTQTFAMRALTPAQLAVLDSLCGHTVVYCDTYGRRVIGAFIGYTSMTVPMSGNLADASLVLTEVSYDEAV